MSLYQTIGKKKEMHKNMRCAAIHLYRFYTVLEENAIFIVV